MYPWTLHSIQKTQKLLLLASRKRTTSIKSQLKTLTIVQTNTNWLNKSAATLI